MEVAITQRHVDLGQSINTIGLFFITAPLNPLPGDHLMLRECFNGVENKREN